MAKSAEGIWRDLLEMTESRQELFMKRVIFCHTVTKKKAGKAQLLRLPPNVWDLEADVCCLGSAVLEKMSTFRDPSNLLAFPKETLESVMTSFIEGALEPFSLVVPFVLVQHILGRAIVDCSGLQFVI